jgi:mannose-6-phosphate isomerase-like protein (cupin superfamily)
MKVMRTVPTQPVSEQLSVQRLSDDLGTEKMHVNVWMLAEGSMMKHMHHEQEELYLVLEGVAAMEVDGVTYELRERDVLSVPAGATHQMSNAGTGPVTFFAVSAPPVSGDAEKM